MTFVSCMVYCPLVGCAVGIFTILAAFWLAKQNGRLPQGSMTPPISFSGTEAPERYIYQVGFTLTGILLLVSVYHWQQTFYPFIKRSFGRWTANGILLGGFVAVFGVVGQGIITLEANLFENLKSGKGISSQSVVHQELAGVFFLGAAMHAYVTIYYVFASALIPSMLSHRKTQDIGRLESSNRCCYGTRSILFKIMCAGITLIAWPLAHALHPTKTLSTDYSYLNAAGTAQYFTVLAYISFFGSYTVDFLSLPMDLLSNEQEETKPKTS